jgi:hypothetical protein
MQKSINTVKILATFCLIIRIRNLQNLNIPYRNKIETYINVELIKYCIEKDQKKISETHCNKSKKGEK